MINHVKAQSALSNVVAEDRTGAAAIGNAARAVAPDLTARVGRFPP
jgi:lactam utilization protein B